MPHLPKSSSETVSVTGRVCSFRPAIIGIGRIVYCQHNAWVHLAATIVVLADAFCFGSRQLIGVGQSSRSPSDSLKAQQHVAPGCSRAHSSRADASLLDKLRS